MHLKDIVVGNDGIDVVQPQFLPGKPRLIRNRLFEISEPVAGLLFDPQKPWFVNEMLGPSAHFLGCCDALFHHADGDGRNAQDVSTRRTA